MYELVPGLIASTLAVWIVSLLIRSPTDADALMRDMQAETDERPTT
ncbi:hypothetical protein NOGI109294_15885 [Nocardiopsis gilva]|nr:hypothetical protein [Nocardiopsis gilva]